MKKHIVAALIASVTVISGAQAGVPVAIDANPEWAVEAQRWTERLKQWQDTVNHYQKQINAYKQELLTKTGIRDVQGLVQSAQSVSKELENIYDQGNSFIDDYIKEGANKRGNSSRLTQSFHFFMFEPIFSPVNALNQPI